MEIKEIRTTAELEAALALCYRILGGEESELYGREVWYKRLEDGLQPLFVAKIGENVVSAVLGRAENADSMVIGFVACDENYRRRGITKALMERFEQRAREMGYRYITLGSKADLFYEKCGYHVICKMEEQNIYQKKLR